MYVDGVSSGQGTKRQTAIHIHIYIYISLDMSSPDGSGPSCTLLRGTLVPGVRKAFVLQG